MSKKNKRQASRSFSALGVKTVEFNPDYTIIKRDLKRIGTLAGIFFALLVVLAIFQNQLISLLIK
jgi:hypothetical protein